MIKFNKVSPWFMWFVGYTHGFMYFMYFKPNGYMWQFFVFVCVTYVIGYILWRIFHERHIQKGG